MINTTNDVRARAMSQIYIFAIFKLALVYAMASRMFKLVTGLTQDDINHLNVVVHSQPIVPNDTDESAVIEEGQSLEDLD